MLQGPFELTVTALINSLFMRSQPRWKQKEGRRSQDAWVRFLAL